MSNDELFKAMSMFQEGAKSYAISRGIQSATQQVDELNKSTMSALEKRQAQTQLSNQLAMQLAGLGASGQQIQTAVGAVAPPTIQDSKDAFMQGMMANDPDLIGMAKQAQGFEIANQKMMQDNQQAFTGKENALNRDLQRELAGARGDKAGAKLDMTVLKDKQKEYVKDSREFNTFSRALNNARGLLKSNSPMSVSAIGVILARASGEKGPLTETEQQIFKGKQDLLSRLQRQLSTNAKSQVTAGDKKALLQLVEQYASANDSVLSDLADLHVSQAAALLGEENVDEIGRKITGGRWKPKQPAASQTSQPPAKSTGASGGWGAGAPSADGDWTKFLK